MTIALGRLGKRGTSIPVVRLAGAVGIGASPMRSALSLASVSKALDKAFGYRKAPAVALAINSPGGSAVQSHLIFRRIRDLSVEKQKPVIAFVEDVAGSGGYMIACAADEIVADPASIVGSIGVLAQGFGFHRLLERIGVERRIYRAGDSKAMLDPFQPENADEVAHLERLQREVHEHFIALVRERRGARLADSPDLFSGLFWSGRVAQELGLVDRLGDLRGVLRERYGRDASPRLIQPSRPSLLRRAANGIAGAAVGETAAALEERALWERYGL